MAAPITYPPDLPISQRRDELLAAIRDHQVVVVAGETGSGKSTQLPKMCLELGLGERGWIGHTQPRRIAARSIAERVAEELNDEVGGVVGYKVRFTDKVSKRTAIKTMTDGILLAEMQHDRTLRNYSTIIVDEAHERSLNIDFLLGTLKTLLPKRPDLKVIITSATIDTARFSEHFDDAPIIEVSGRLYPVDTRYREPVDLETGEAIPQTEAIVDAVRELELEGPGDVLVFCAGERDIREAADALTDARLRDTEILPLYGRLSAAEQHRVFDRRGGGRRVVVATNVAETSLTVPGIRYVVDTGTARISRYSHRTKVQRLPVEAVSQASANQRAGRCGRLGPGICIRLYSEEDFEARDEFTEPEITRTNLASVILQMATLRLGNIERFPFVDPPELRNVRDGIALLEELDAIDPDHEGTKKWVTPIGRDLSRLPIDPRLGRMVIDAAESGCLREVIIITAAMSVQDPRERPSEKREEAGQMHARFRVPGSDFLAWVQLWEHLESEREKLSNSAFRRMCRREFLNFNRIREWQDIVRQVTRAVQDMGDTINTQPADHDVIHQSLLTGLLSQVGLKDANSNEFAGGRNARFMLGRSSSLAKKPPTWVMAGELVETNRLWAHSAARIQPEWAERAGEHLVRRSYTEPEWDREKGSAMSIERVTLYGVPLVAGRRVHYRRVDPETAREMFIHHALIEGEWETHHAFFSQNEEVLDEVRRMGARHRQDLFVEYDVLFRFYDERVSETVTSGADFDKWWNRRRKKSPRLLDLRLDEIFDADAVGLDEAAFPESFEHGDVSIGVDYEFDAGSEQDGVIFSVPIALVGHVDPAAFEWNVPGLREELVTALIRTMPKSLRKPFVPVPDTVEAVMPRLTSEENAGLGIVDALRRELSRLSGDSLPVDAIELSRVPAHLQPTWRVVDDDGEILAAGRDLDEIRQRLDQEVSDVLDTGEHELVATGQTGWTFGTLPESLETHAAGQAVTAWPALVDEGETVGVRLLADEGEAWQSMWLGTRRLLRLNVGGAARRFANMFDNRVLLALSTSPHATRFAWVDDASDCAFNELLDRHGGPPRDEAGWNRLVDAVRADLAEVVDSVGAHAVAILIEAAALRADLEGGPPAVRPARADMAAQLDRLTYAGSLSGVGAARLRDVHRYLRAMRVRLDKLPDRIRGDTDLMARCRSLEDQFDELAQRFPGDPKIEELNWLLEEFRVASFAQQIGVDTSGGKVSESRIRKLMRNW